MQLQLCLVLAIFLCHAAPATGDATASADCKASPLPAPRNSKVSPPSPLSFDVKDKVVLVTGSNRGIGLSIIEGLLDAGAAKAYAGVRALSTADDLVTKYGSDRVIPVQIDMSDRASITNAAAIAQDVELVVNNAGILELVQPFEGEKFLQALKNQLDVNVIGLVHMAQAFAPILEKNGGGSFVQINSTSSLRCPGAKFAGYAASKAAAFSITQALSSSLPNTLVLSVHPGPIATDMVDQFNARDRSEAPEQVSDAIIDALKRGDQFLVYPDTVSKRMGESYAGFADEHLTGRLGY